MKKSHKLISVIIATLIVAIVPLITNSLKAANEIYGSMVDYNVFVSENYNLQTSTVEGALAVLGNLTVEGESTKLVTANSKEENLGNAIEQSELPSLVVKGELNSTEGTSVYGNLITLLEGISVEDLNYDGEVTYDTSDNLDKGLRVINDQIEELTEVLMNRQFDVDDANIYQSADSYYDNSDKSLIITDLQGSLISSDDDRYEEVEVDETVESSGVKEDDTTGINQELIVDQFSIGQLQDNEKIIIRSYAKYINFEQTEVYFENKLLTLEDDNELLQDLANRIVWVFPNAEEVTINDANLIGTILSPKASIEATESTISGQVFTKSLNQINSTVVNTKSFATDYDFKSSPEESDITIEFVDENENEIRDPLVYTREVGSTFTTVLPTIDGYEVESQEQVENLSEGITVPENDSKVIIEYSTNFTANLTVNYIDEEGNQIAESESFAMNSGDSYTTEAKEIDGYTLIGLPDNAEGTMEEVVVVDYVYTPTTTSKKVIIQYVDTAGSELLDSVTLNVEVGTEYDVTEYMLDSSSYTYQGLHGDSAPISGIVEDDIVVIFEYSLNSTCSNLGSSITDKTTLDLSGKKQATSAEVQFNEVKSTGLVEEQGETVETEAYDFGTEYSLDSTNDVFMDYRYSYNSNEDYDTFIPIRQDGDFEPINIVVSDDGNAYDLRSRVDTSDITTYTNGGINYQSEIGSSYRSMNVRFEQCQVVVSINNRSSSSNGTEIMTIPYTEAVGLGETLAGVQFNWDESNRAMEVVIVTEKDGELLYSNNSFTIDLNGYQSFSPNDYSIVFENTSNTTTKLYKPYSSQNRYMYEIIAAQSPYVDTSTRNSRDLSDVMNYNQIYGVYSVNGTIKDSSRITSSRNVASYSLPYNPKGYKTMVSGRDTIDRRTEAVYGYVVDDSYSPFSGFTMSAEAPVIFAKNKHPEYSLSTDINGVSFVAGQYSSLSEYENVSFTNTLSKDGDQVTSGDAYDNIVARILDESDVNFESSGSYDATGYAQTRNPETGEYARSASNIDVTIAAATMDYGDAPSTYGEAGARVGSSRYRYTLGINRNSSRSNHADADYMPLYSDDARGDDTHNMTDETGWFNMNTNGIGELNVELSDANISFPYTASGSARVALWIDYNQNGTFESYEGTIQSVSSSSMDSYGTVNFDISLDPSYSTIEAGDTVFARARIISGSSLSTSNASTTFNSNYGETEDFQINFYGKKNEYQICTQVLADSPMVTVKDVTEYNTRNDNDRYDYTLYDNYVVYTFDVGDESTTNTYGYYENVTATITSNQGISSNTRAGQPVFFYVTASQSPNESPSNTIKIKIRDENGDPLNLPLTFSFWDLDDFTSGNVVESVSLDKSSIYTEGLEAEDVKTTADTVGQIEDYDSYIKLSTTEQVDSEPYAMFLLQGDSLAKSDIEIVEEARLLEIGFGFDLGQKDMILEECVEPYEPKAQIEIMDQFYEDEVSIYNSYPFQYQSTNIPFPYFSNFNSVTQNLYIPEGVEFSEDDTAVKVYRRDLFGTRTEDDWELVDSSNYTQKLDLNNNISSVTFDNLVENNLYGYEYRMEYNFEISEEMETGQKVVFKSDFEYNKGKTGETTESFTLNDVTAIVKEDFTADINSIMGDDTIYIEEDSTAIYYTYEYQNCETCENQEEPQLLSGNIEIPIPDEEDMQFYSDSDFDKFEDILFTIYDNEMKVFEVTVRRWYPTEIEGTITGDIEEQIVSNNMNPVGQTVKLRPAYKKYEDEGITKPVTTLYSQEVITVTQSSETNTVSNGMLTIDDLHLSITTEPQATVPASWVSAEIDTITIEDLAPVFDPTVAYIPVEEELCSGIAEEGEEVDTECVPRGYHTVNIDSDALDSTLETSKTTFEDQDYKSVYFRNNLKVDEDGNVSINPTLDTRYKIEEFSGRIYNNAIKSECKLESEADDDYTGMYCYNDERANYHIPTEDTDKIIDGYNDINDPDLVLTDLESNSIPLNMDIEVGEEYDYNIHFANFGLNDVSITIADKFEVVSKAISYYNDGSYYFKRTSPSSAETECIKEASCSGDYQIIASGQIDNPAEIKDQLEEDTNKLSNYKTINEWLESIF